MYIGNGRSMPSSQEAEVKRSLGHRLLRRAATAPARPIRLALDVYDKIHAAPLSQLVHAEANVFQIDAVCGDDVDHAKNLER